MCLCNSRHGNLNYDADIQPDLKATVHIRPHAVENSG